IDGFKLKRTTNFRLATTPSMTTDQIWKYIYLCYQNYKDTPIYNGACQLFELLHSKTQESIKFVTTRPINSAHHTHKLIRSICDVPFQISFANEPYSKINYLNGIKYFVEDRRAIAKELAAHNKLVFLIDKKYNQMPEHSSISRIHGLSHLIEHVNEFVKKMK
ncbi:unnamed protein product, partial [marine sediment metagenome]